MTVGQSAEGLVDVLAERGIVQTAETVGLQRRVIVMLAQRLRPQERLDFDQALTELERAVEIALDVIAKGARQSDEGDLVDAVLTQVAERTKAADLDGAAQALDDALAKIDMQEAEQREATRRKRVLFLEAAIEQHTLRRDVVAVVNRIELLVAIDQRERPARSSDFLAQYDKYLADGETNGINFSLLIAIECARRMVAAARDEGERGTSATLFGDALWTLGERENGSERLLEAVGAYRDALKERTRERVPLDWAMTQNNLGNALWTLGGRENGTERLLEAVDAYRDALKEWTRERAPLQWATTQNNLGTALQTLGARENGSERLLEAVDAYRDALKEWTRERVPLDWAMTQNNLGNALSTLGERENGTERLLEAVDACRDALKELTRERAPLQWATTQNNLGNALSTLGERENGTERLLEAVGAYRDALKERTRERVPLDWAATQNNLGTALQTLGERENGTERRLRSRRGLPRRARGKDPRTCAAPVGNNAEQSRQRAPNARGTRERLRASA